MTTEKIPEYGDMIPLNEFIDDCMGGWFIDYDGYGYYSDGEVMFNDVKVLPSDIVYGKINHSHKFVIWFNR